ncbi:tRNA 2-methylthio-N6-isopentenyl adenosine(37) hydroxylase MiaE-like protein [Actinomycetaceae bacterium WB03_NA08]|uniref:tRNA 2-methylthio-N6-isopentenyl adenosine(37) hydroxylase MiaE-like protein n=1 Tax=Scrofimicrobium canadense TaxID=2652290 RepID=A0A6N7W6V9_9ACTO|nr:ferritin-like fold-containing protein [Scrofimicrobium canadense]MSS84233.1 tRNA 2-methylthio-N6-isopentenyl adenosine(37) hydroxylase MiaE-like protein [Scrofimicrobium canadense]
MSIEEEQAEFQSEESPLSEGATQVTGLLAYSSLAAMTRLSKDGDQAPQFSYSVEHARMAALAFREFRHLEKFSEVAGLDLEAAAGQFAGLFDELDQRTRPSNWWERSVKTYVTIGIFSDALLELTLRHQLFVDAQWSGDFGQGVWERDHLAPLTEADPQLVARLSLWSRRVAGEVFALLRATLFSYPELAGDPDTVDAVVKVATDGHRARLESVYLKA